MPVDTLRRVESAEEDGEDLAPLGSLPTGKKPRTGAAQAYTLLCSLL